MQPQPGPTPDPPGPPPPGPDPTGADRPAPPVQESLASLLGGRTGAVDATVPPVAFVLAWLIAGESGAVDPIVAGVTAALASAGLLAVWRLRRTGRRGARPRAVLVGLLMVGIAALIVLRTGRAADFFLVQLVANAASALAWVVSITIRWPLLGVVVGAVSGQKARWRRDPWLLRAYGRGSWVWVGQYAVRLAVLTPLWLADQVVALGAARVALTWPLIAACLAVSWWVVRRSLPPDHPGLRHPALPAIRGTGD